MQPRQAPQQGPQRLWRLPLPPSSWPETISQSQKVYNCAQLYPTDHICRLLRYEKGTSLLLLVHILDHGRSTGPCSLTADTKQDQASLMLGLMTASNPGRNAAPHELAIGIISCQCMQSRLLLQRCCLSLATAHYGHQLSCYCNTGGMSGRDSEQDSEDYCSAAGTSMQALFPIIQNQ